MEARILADSQFKIKRLSPSKAYYKNWKKKNQGAQIIHKLKLQEWSLVKNS